MAAYKTAAVNVTPPNDFSLGLIRSHMVVIHLFLMLCDLQRVVRYLCPTLYNKVPNNIKKVEEYKPYKRKLKSFLTKHAFYSLDELLVL
jgi:hypothetical protein